MTRTYNFDLFTRWDATFLDPTDSTLSKLLVKESSFEDKKEKSNLEQQLFESYCLALQAESEHCSLKSILDIPNDKYKIHNQRIKSNVLGKFILSSLTESAIPKLQESKSKCRMLLTCSILFNLHTRSIDFTVAFPNADAGVIV